jgi:hypothetical protein
MTYRGLKTTLASVAIGVAAFWVTPLRLAWWIMAFALMCVLFGCVVQTRDWYHDLKRYARERDEFNRRLREQS